ncbi:hypothetical protein D3C74_491350 [compost metagenome]
MRCDGICKTREGRNELTHEGGEGLLAQLGITCLWNIPSDLNITAVLREQSKLLSIHTGHTNCGFLTSGSGNSGP